MKKISFILMIPAILISLAGMASAYTVPEDYSMAKYLYVFGPEGNPYYGADDVDHNQEVYIDVPADATGDVTIGVYDPDTGGFLDQKPDVESGWDTVIEFAVYGSGNTVLAKEKFGESKEYDKAVYTFGPFAKEKGEKVGNAYRFKLVANALEGEDQNLFNVRISPDSAESWSPKISLRLLPNKGDKMYFYPEIPADTAKVVIQNYDIDPDGASGEARDPDLGGRFRINDSASAEWTETALDLNTSKQPHRLEYVITKKTQRYANAAIRVKDDKGNILPIYYRAGKPVAPEKPMPMVKAPDLKCNKFTFDATSSYDPNNEKLSFLWDFGDGTTSTEPVVTHIYEKGGQYNVTLTVQDSSGLTCDTSTTTQLVKVNTPPEPAFSAPESSCVGDEITFDASATKDDSPGNLSYAWDFGDGTSGEGKRVNKIFEKGGTYKVRLTVNDNAGTACSIETIQKMISINSSPIADAGEDMDLCLPAGQEYKITFDGSRSKDPDGDKLEYNWDFGDGVMGNAEKVTHVYKKGGSYTVVLSVNDGSESPCSSASDVIKVKLNKQPIAVAGENITVCVGTEIALDGSASKDPDGDALSYKWSFGDGMSAEGAKVKHSYAKSGSYRPVLEVDDGQGTKCSVATDSLSVFVNSGPTASLAKAEAACVGSRMDFDASNSSDPDNDGLRYSWDFGDGVTSEGGSKASHTYQKGGTYSVRVTVDDKRQTPCSIDSATTKVYVNTPPVANAGPNLVCCADEESDFDGSASSDADGDTLKYMWDFGDGDTAEGVKVKHVYKKGGNYRVVLRVEDNSGTHCNSSSSSFTARVNEQPVPVIKIK